MTKKMTIANFTIGILMLGLSASAFAQSADGSIRGTVVDPSGALVQQAQVTVTSTAGFSQTLTSDGSGAFHLPHLAPGNYSISINAMGFTPALESIQVSGNHVTNEEIKLGISVFQEIEVSANDTAPASDTAR